MANLERTRTVALAIGIMAVLGLSATAEAQEKAYVANLAGGTTSVIDLATHTVVATIPTPTQPLGAVVSPDGSRAYVTAGPPAIHVIDTATDTVLTAIALPNQSSAAAITEDGSKLYVPAQFAGSIAVIDTATNTIANTIDLTSVGNFPTLYPMEVQGGRGYLARDRDVVVIDTDTDTVVTTLTTTNASDGQIRHAVPFGNRLYVFHRKVFGIAVIDLDTGTQIATIPFAKSVAQFSTGAISPDGSTLYAPNLNWAPSKVLAIDTSTFTVTSIPSGTPNSSFPSAALNADGTILYAPNMLRNEVAVIDTTTNTLLTTVPVGASPQAYGHFIAAVATTAPQSEEEPATPAERYAEAVLADAPIAYWQLDETSGTTAADSSGNGNDGTYKGGTTLGQAGAFEGSLAPTFANGYVEIPGTWGGDPELTVEAWFNPSSTINDWMAIISSLDESGFLHVQLHSYGDIAVYTNTGTIIMPIPSQAPLNTWRHIAVVVQSGNSTTYVDGVPIGAHTMGFSVVNPVSMIRIASGYGGGRFFPGSIDDVAIYDTALSQQQIQAHLAAAQ